MIESQGACSQKAGNTLTKHMQNKQELARFSHYDLLSTRYSKIDHVKCLTTS